VEEKREKERCIRKKTNITKKVYSEKFLKNISNVLENLFWKFYF